jgi:prevent-host-death family protein
MMVGEEMGIAELKAHLSEVLRRVAEGETVTVTDRGRPVASIVPVERREKARHELIEMGLIRPARQPHRPLPDPLDIGPHAGLFDAASR